MIKNKFIFFMDPGHGWLRVSKKFLKDNGIPLGCFTPCSYQSARFAYLEEDCDLTTFGEKLIKKGVVKDWKELNSRIVEKHTNRESKIRDLPSISNKIN